ncbi:deleted in malignant brain tumors 1 protein-like [Colossoma macropomum]|uniref:deleted in malignant brain tumors 1 protein-like n=1 Tax=Colossoma macropomum TaxID=42526 RepID=UPI001863A81A|nr:deleted in malignant brain tumors 1 protein-like [Colossoma macropomum]
MLTAVILMIICSTAEMSEVRMVDGDGRCSGIPQVLHEGQWRKLSNGHIEYSTIGLLCRELNCGDVVSATFGSDFRGKHGDQSLIDLYCDGSESLSECKKYRSSIQPDYLNISITVSCSDSVRLVDGAGRCSGRVEVKSHQSWSSVCESDFDQQDAEVVCRELDCGTPLILQGALLGEGKHPFGTKEFQCKGSENRLLTCSTSDREEHTCTPGKAVSLTCSGPDDVRLVDGSSRCAGTLEMFRSGEWRGVTADRWSMKEAAVVCRQLDCGSAVKSTMSVPGGDETRWGFHIACKGSESAVKECTILYSSKIRYPVGVVCSDSVRLADGAGLCSGRVEVKPHQSWTSVCEADFNQQDAEVVCRELGCGAPLTLQGALFGEGKHQFGTKEFQCKGTEKSLLTCSTSERQEQNCTPGKAVGLTCSEPDEMRLVEGSSRCAGTVEIFYNGQWRKVGAEVWNINTAAMVCRQLDCGSAVAATKIKSDGDVPEVGVLISCSMLKMKKCHPMRIRRIEYHAGVICSESRSLQGPEVFKGHSFTITCSTQPQYPGGSFHLTLPWTSRNDSQAAVSHSASFLFPAADDSHQGIYSCVYENQVSFQNDEFQEESQKYSNRWSPGPFIHNFSSESEPLSLIVTALHAEGLQIAGPGRQWTAMLTAAILMIICSTAEMSEVRMVDGDGRCSGIPEVLHEGQWRKLSNGYIEHSTTGLLCRELNCGDVVRATFGSDFREKRGSQSLIDLYCDGSESLSECKKYPSSIQPDYLNISITVSCSDSVRLVDGDGRCSGRVEVKAHQSWTSVCESDFDQQDAEVVCRELDCATPLTLQGALFGEGEHPFGTKQFQCKGSENRLLTCSTSDREENTCTPGKAVSLTCSGPDDVRLVDGSSRCAGTLEIFHSGEWRGVTADRWSMKEAAVMCRQLDCGSAVKSTMSVPGGGETGWGFHIACKGSESAVKECTILYSSKIRYPVGVVCSDSVRLVDGTGRCSGRVEVKSNQSWTTVCEADFDWQDAEVVCRELSCGTPQKLQEPLLGEGKHPFGTKEFQCKGTENRLPTCSTSDRKKQNYTPGKAVCLTCSEPDGMRLVDGNSRCAGTVEMFYNGQWRKVAADVWEIEMAAAVCRQLDCGSALAATKSKSGRDKPEVGVLISCSRTKTIKCRPIRIRQIDYLAGVICSEFLAHPTISVSTPIRESRSLQGPEVFRGYSFTITCSTQPQYPGGSFHLTLPWNNRSDSQAAVSHSASFLFPAADDSHQGNYSCVYENQVSFQNDEFQEESQKYSNSWSPGPFIHNFSSESEPLPLIITDFSWTPFITRMLLVPFLMLITCSFIFLIFKKCGHFFIRDAGKERAAAAVPKQSIQLVSL